MQKARGVPMDRGLGSTAPFSLTSWPVESHQSVRRFVRRTSELLYTRHLLSQSHRWERPEHIGILIDGNRRWARSMGLLDPSDGHRAGGERVRQLCCWLDLVGVRQVTIFMLSDDNLRRDRREVDTLMGIVTSVVNGISEPMDPWRVKVIGALDLLPGHMVSQLKGAEARTADRTKGVQVNLAVGYGGQREIADAVRAAIEAHVLRGGTLDNFLDELDVDRISQHVYTAHHPQVDLIIRTSGEQRLSGFLMWQSAYAELYFCDCYWPDFRLLDLLRALRSYSQRSRRFGR
jgi:short-chain Z-isoprenyl diphosphate synthase